MPMPLAAATGTISGMEIHPSRTIRPIDHPWRSRGSAMTMVMPTRAITHTVVSVANVFHPSMTMTAIGV